MAYQPNNVPGLSQYSGAQNYNELMQGAGLQGMDGFLPLGADTLVYMGPDYADPNDKSGKGGMVPIDWAMSHFYQLDDVQYGRFANGVSTALGWDVSKAPERIQSTYNSMVQQAAAYTKATGEAMSPFQMLEMQNARNARLGLLPQQKAAGGVGGPRKVIDFTNEQDAEVLIDNAMTQALGREANDMERETFYSALNKLARKNPRVATSEGTMGGINQQLAAKQFAQSQGDAAEFTAATQYTEWLQQALMEDTNLGARSGL